MLRTAGLTPSEYRTRHVGRGAALIPGCYAMLWAGGFNTATSKKRTAPGRETQLGGRGTLPASGRPHMSRAVR